jgi:hypothetical protein
MLLAAKILETYVGQTEPTSTTDIANKSIVLCGLAFDDTAKLGCCLALQQGRFGESIPLE